MKTLSLTFLCLVLLIFMSGCSKHSKIKNDLDTYANRLQSYTGIALTENDFSYQLQAPAKIKLKQEVTEFTINLRDFFALNGCALNQLIAQRNTALGKMQLPSTRFAYESALIVELAKCTETLQAIDAKSALLEKLALWTSKKKQVFPIVWANLITQSNEVYSHLTSASDFISGNASDSFQSTKQALRFLLITKTELPVNLSELELHLQQLANTPLMARIWRTQLLLSQNLDQISLLLTKYLANNQCLTLQEEQSVQIMQNIFRKLFAQAIQPLGAELNKYHYQLTPLIEELTSSPYFTNEFGAYLRRHNEHNYEVYRMSMQKHIGLWQDIFARCN